MTKQHPTLNWRKYPFWIPHGHTGFGWAARAEVLRKVMLYDRAIVGSGDSLIFSASHYCEPYLSEVEAQVKSSKSCKKCGYQNESSAYTKNYKQWAQQWHKAVDGKIGYAPMLIEDMYHGDHVYRHYKRRRDILTSYQYDPTKDVSIDNQGLLTWSTNKQELPEVVKMYFLSRCEDA